MLVAQIIVDGLMIGGMYSLEAMGLLIIYGVLRVLNLAHGEFLLIGSYLTIAFFSLNPLLGPAISIMVLLLVGLALQRYLLTDKITGNRPTTPLIITFGISITLQNVYLELFTANPYGISTPFPSLNVLGVYFPVSTLSAFLIAIVSLVVIYFVLNRTFLGMAIRAATKSPDDASLIGIDVRRVKTIAFVLGAVLAAIAGSVMTLQYSVTPYTGLTFLMIAFTVIVLGGFSVPGVLAAGFVLGIAGSVWGFYLPMEYTNAVVFAIFLIVIIIRPSGLVGKEGK